MNAALAGSQMYDPHQVAHDQLLKKVNAVQGGQMCTQDQMMQLMQKATPEQCQQILHVLSKNNMDETFSTINMAGNSSLYLVKWIVDSEATDHMITSNTYLHDEKMVGNVGKVHLPTGDSASVSHVGNF